MTDLKLSFPKDKEELRIVFEAGSSNYVKNEADRELVLAKDPVTGAYLSPYIENLWLGYMMCFAELGNRLFIIETLLKKPEVVLANMKRGIIANPFKDLEERCSMLETELDKAFTELRKAHDDLLKVQSKVFADRLMEQNAGKVEALCKACSGQDNV